MKELYSLELASKSLISSQQAVLDAAVPNGSVKKGSVLKIRSKNEHSFQFWEIFMIWGEQFT
jgi:hypothetical protein